MFNCKYKNIISTDQILFDIPYAAGALFHRAKWWIPSAPKMGFCRGMVGER